LIGKTSINTLRGSTIEDREKKSKKGGVQVKREGSYPQERQRRVRLSLRGEEKSERKKSLKKGKNSRDNSEGVGKTLLLEKHR